jgi:hypothetical protein
VTVTAFVCAFARHLGDGPEDFIDSRN